MAATPDAHCLSEVGDPPGRNVSLLSSPQPCNRSAVKAPPYSPQATALFAIAITFMMLLTIVGNILVIIAVLTSRSLKGPQNLFLVSLAAADILVATLIIPFSLANELQGFWAFSSIWCEIYLALDVLFCTSSIVHLCAIALDRFLSISRPVSYGAKRTPVRIKAAIIVVWLISAVISFPPLLTLDKSEGGEEACELNNERWYILYSTIGSFFAPCVIMILVYVRIYQIAKQHTRCPLGKKHKPGVMVDPGVPTTPVKLPEQLHQVSNEKIVTESQQEQVLTKVAGTECIPSLLEDPPGKPSNQEPEHNPSLRVPKSLSAPSIAQLGAETFPSKAQKHPETAEETLPDSTPGSGSEAEMEVGNDGALRVDEKEGGNKVGRQALQPSHGRGLKVHMLNVAGRYKNTVATSTGTKLVHDETPKAQGTPISRRKAMLNREKRFTFVLAVVMGVFVICWFPFFFSYSLQAVCPKTCSIPIPLFKFFFWIGYCNSCLNPVIYTIFNNDFRKAFKRILCRDTKGTFF